MNKDIDLLTCLLQGINLIEANAGTGKTYTITALTARMIAEWDYPIDKILVVTFTKAAVSDLKSKIYDRLTDLRDGFINSAKGETPTDGFVRDYVADKKSTADISIKRLSNAIRDFDTASIFTIHSFCQRMLTENSFSGKIAYDTEMTGDASEILINPVRDFWRRYIYSLPAEAARLFANDTPESLTKFLMRIQNNPSVKLINCPDADLDGLLERRKELENVFGTIKNTPDEIYDHIFSLIFPENGASPLNGGTYKIDGIRGVIQGIRDQILLNDCVFYAFKDGKRHAINLTSESIASKVKKGFETPEHHFFGNMSRWQQAYDTYAEYMNDFYNSMLLKLKEYTDSVLDKHRMRINSQSYNDLIIRMHSAMAEPDSRMAEHIKTKFKAVLIDEFQDTDPLQYDIFMNSFGRHGLPVFMIGDPKQAIYSFRGADVYTYLKASSDREPLTLTVNHRSDKDLVEAVNGIFRRNASFLIDKISYNDSKGDLNIKVTESGKTISPLTVWHAESATKESLASACAYEISRLLNAQAQITDKDGSHTVRPSDFAVLVRGRKQAIAVRDSLSECAVPCVISGSENVFASKQATDMACLLAAAISPYSERAVRTALVTDIFGYTADQLFNLSDTDEWEGIFELFIKLSDTLKSAGVAPMFFRAAKIAGMHERLAGTRRGERKLTNLIHLTELLQRHEADKKASPEQLLLWINERISQSDTRHDEYELKMDSDENAVTITTIHKSKGLEYNIVFTPFLMLPGNSNKKESITSFHDDSEELVMDFSGTEEANSKHSHEALAEDLRLAYVAITRARAVCYTAWGTGRDSGRTALFYLIHGEDGKYSTDQFYNFFADKPFTSVSLMPFEQGQIYAAPNMPQASPNLAFNGSIKQPWRINSFSGLIHSSSSARDTEQFTASEPKASDSYSIFTFPKGAKAGSCLHECMEEIPLNSFTHESVKETAEAKLAEYFFDPEFVPAVTDNLETILSRELIPSVTLKGIKRDDYVHEMEFHIYTKNFRSSTLAEIFKKFGQEDFARACSSLDFSAAGGFLTGFSDLIFCSGGKYYVLDWKSNHLGGNQSDYSMENMHAEMMKSHYYLQLYFYTLALHMHLEQSLVGYDYDTHIGGAIYVFMRGVGKKGDEGIYFHKPDKNIIMAMREAAANELNA